MCVGSKFTYRITVSLSPLSSLLRLQGTGLDSRRYGFSCPEPVIDKFDKLLSSVDRKRRVLSACFRDRHVFSGHVWCLLAAAAVVHHMFVPAAWALTPHNVPLMLPRTDSCTSCVVTAAACLFTVRTVSFKICGRICDNQDTYYEDG